MCPWPRIQGAMLDEHSMLVTYRRDRGEPRGSHKRGQSWDGRGDCVDCKACVAVCPMGIDIRDGNQLECINCALCVDACNNIMDRVGRPRGLIAYDTLAGMAEPEVRGKKRITTWQRLRLLRPRTLLYAASIIVVGAIMLATLLARGDTDITVLRDRNPLFVQLSDGSFRNGYTVKLQNKRHQARAFRILTDGLTDATLSAVGGDNQLSVGPDQLRTLRIYVAAPVAATPAAVTHFDIVATDLETGERYRHATTFRRAQLSRNPGTRQPDTRTGGRRPDRPACVCDAGRVFPADIHRQRRVRLAFHSTRIPARPCAMPIAPACNTTGCSRMPIASRRSAGRPGYSRTTGPYGCVLRTQPAPPLPGFAGTAQVGRPASDSEDRVLDAIETSPGIYQAAGPTLDPGRWRVVFELEGDDGRRFRAEEELMVQR